MPVSEIERLERQLLESPNDKALREEFRRALAKSPQAGQYQNRDWHLFDYDMRRCERIPFPIRGPAPSDLSKGRYGVALGSAAGFGALVATPYPRMVGDALQIPMLNLCHGGASPEFYLRAGFAEIGDILSNARFVLIEVFSGRSTSSHMFKSVDGRRMAVPRNQPKATPLPMEDILRKMFQQKDFETAEAIVRSMQVNYVLQFNKLLELIRTPKILVYLSRRALDAWSLEDYVKNPGAHNLDIFPQMVEKWMVDAVRTHADGYVETVSSRGLPTHAVDRFTNEPTTYEFNALSTQSYYPSQEMHSDVADNIVIAIRKLSFAEA